MTNYVQLVNFVVDVLLALWFFRPIQAYPGRKKAAFPLCLALFLVLCPIYLQAFSYSGSLLDSAERFALRVAVYSVYVHFVKGRRWDISIAIAVMAWLTFTAGNNIMLIPVMESLRMKELAFTANPVINYILCDLLEFGLYTVIITIVSRLLPMDSMKQMPAFRVEVLTALTLIEFYVKMSLAQLAPLPAGTVQTTLTLYPLLMQFLVLLALVFLERLMFDRAQQEEQHMAELANEYRVEYAQVSSDAETSIRQLHHDLRNHLNTIRRLSGDNERLENYITQLLDDGFESYESLISTGNTLLDGLISAKIRRARQENIEVSANVDFRDGAFLPDTAVCTIFGNALDNAIEASLRVQDKDLRSINLRCGTAAGRLVITISNYFEGELKIRSGLLPATVKTEEGHGLGLAGIRRTVQHYGGSMVFSTDELHNFILTISLPIPETADETEIKTA